MILDQIVLGDCVEGMKKLPDGCVDLVFSDQPFNINLNYDVYQDNRPYAEYVEWTQRWVDESYRILKPSGAIYACIGDEFVSELGLSLKKAGFSFRNKIVWYYTFGENQKQKFNRCHTNIWYFTKSPTGFTFNTEAIRVPSARQWKYKDKRAKSSGKIPDDVWEVPATEWLKDMIRKAEAASLPNGQKGISGPVLDLLVDEMTTSFVGDMWKISRLCGTFKERIKNKDGSVHPCQMPCSILHRIIKASSNEGDIVLDPFVGSGTTMIAAKTLGRRYLGYEISPAYYEVAINRVSQCTTVETPSNPE